MPTMCAERVTGSCRAFGDGGQALTEFFMSAGEALNVTRGNDHDRGR